MMSDPIHTPPVRAVDLFLAIGSMRLSFARRLVDLKPSAKMSVNFFPSDVPDSLRCRSLTARATDRDNAAPLRVARSAGRVRVNFHRSSSVSSRGDPVVGSGRHGELVPRTDSCGAAKVRP